jgi:hypothetical protein
MIDDAEVLLAFESRSVLQGIDDPWWSLKGRLAKEAN